MKPTGSLSLKTRSSDQKNASRIRRFTKTERLLHWSFALPQIVLMATGGWLLLFASRTGESFVKADIVTAHKIAAGCFVAAPILVFIGGDAGALLRNIRLALSWNGDDLRWLYRSFAKVFVASVRVPASGKFNAGQKINMLLVMTLGTTLVISGALMWFFEGLLLAWIIHSMCFMLAFFMVLGHVYMAIAHPPTRPSFWAIITGHVDREWANHHHSQWIKELDDSYTDED